MKAANGQAAVSRELRAEFRRKNLRKVLRSWQLYVLLIPALIWAVVFAYYPMYGLIIAFKDYKIRLGILGSPWVDPWYKWFMK